MNKTNLSSQVLILVFFILTLSACKSSVENNITNIQVKSTLPESSVIEPEEITISNCDGNVELIESLGILRPVQKEIKLDNIAMNSSGSSYKITEALKLQFEIEIDKAYEDTYSTTTENLKNVILRAAPAEIMVFTIRWERMSFNSQVSFIVGDEVFLLPYSYHLNIPKLNNKDSQKCIEKSKHPTSSETPTRTIVNRPSAILIKTVYLFKVPIATSIVIGEMLKEGDKVFINAKHPFDKWLYVETQDGRRGWLHLDWVEFDGLFSDIPIATLVPTPTKSRPTSYPSQ